MLTVAIAKCNLYRHNEMPLKMAHAWYTLPSKDLSDNAFGPDGADAIRALLTSPVAYTLQTLKFQNNGLGLGGVVCLFITR